MVNPDHIMAFDQSKKMFGEDANVETLETYKDSENTFVRRSMLLSS